MAVLPPTFTAAHAYEAGLSDRDLVTLVSDESVDELSRGVYRRTDAPETAHLDLLAVHLRVPRAVICGESALALHELIDDIPAAVHIAVPRGALRPAISYPPVVVAQYAVKNFDLNIEQYEAAAGEFVPVYDAARSVVDAMRHRHRIGQTLAVAALARYVRTSGPDGIGALQQIARQLNALSIIRPAVEAVLA
ncbi:hypothetical protein AB0P21_31620 [Kribbella sp. NPDC056861]|uniref:type IV toxin-antitoxin system AbiEi family antitoxin domain-containing protein n=1 Tax=Kribbella sp. NPDC056861 TaxID=3154857 RepID=UPI003431F56A